MPEGRQKGLLVCSFCGKYQDEVLKLIAGPSVHICDECIDLCVDILRAGDDVDPVAGDWQWNWKTGRATSGRTPSPPSAWPVEIFIIQAHAPGQIAWHGAFSTKWKAIEHMNTLGIAGDYLLGRRVSLMVFPLDCGERSEGAIAAARLDHSRQALIAVLWQVWAHKMEETLMGRA